MSPARRWRMSRYLTTYTDARLARKVAVVRVFSLLLLLAFATVMILTVQQGEVDVSTRSSLGYTRVSRTVTWTDAPIGFLLQLLLLSVISVGFVAALHLVVVRTVEKLHHRRPRSRQKYPY